LARFVDNPNGLRTTLHLSQSLISGSFIIDFLDPHDTFVPNNLDIYVPHGYHLRLVQYLRQVKHYAFAEDAIWPPYTLEFGVEKIIDIIQSATQTALYPLAFFWTTAVMNYLTADGFCCAYPELMLHRRSLLNPTSLLDYYYPPPRILGCIDKYIHRGFQF
ncbi:hypothetical protein BKA93DRAFT_730208, partial [Sparassis latifolia]